MRPKWFGCFISSSWGREEEDIILNYNQTHYICTDITHIRSITNTLANISPILRLWPNSYSQPRYRKFLLFRGRGLQVVVVCLVCNIKEWTFFELSLPFFVGSLEESANEIVVVVLMFELKVERGLCLFCLSFQPTYYFHRVVFSQRCRYFIRSRFYHSLKIYVVGAERTFSLVRYGENGRSAWFLILDIYLNDFLLHFRPARTNNGLIDNRAITYYLLCTSLTRKQAGYN